MTEPTKIQSKLSIRKATKTVSETELWLHCSGLGRVMGLVFNDLGQETKGILTKRLRYGRINTLYPSHASDDFQHSFLALLKSGGKKKKKTSGALIPPYPFLISVLSPFKERKDLLIFPNQCNKQSC